MCTSSATVACSSPTARLTGTVVRVCGPQTSSATATPKWDDVSVHRTPWTASNSELGSFSFPPPTSHELQYISVTSGFTRLSMKTKYVCRGLISLYVNFHNNRTMWSLNLNVKNCRWGGKEKEPRTTRLLCYPHPFPHTHTHTHTRTHTRTTTHTQTRERERAVQLARFQFPNTLVKLQN